MGGVFCGAGFPVTQLSGNEKGSKMRPLLDKVPGRKNISEKNQRFGGEENRRGEPLS